MLCIFYDAKGAELLTEGLASIPAQKDTVVIRGIVYTVIKRVLDFNEAPPCWRIELEVKV